MITYLLVAAWLTVILLVLRAESAISDVVGAGHSICGPWGCGPPLSSLLVWHGFVTILLVPSAIIAARNWPDVAVDWAPALALVVGLTAAVFMSTSLVTWWCVRTRQHVGT
jgi:hypothetical protein